MKRASSQAGRTCPAGRLWLHLAIMQVLPGCGMTGALSVAAEGASESPPDKSCYNLFHPTPAGLMRELAPDRPDKTESPYTVDAGHLQLEIDFATYTRDRADGTRADTWNFVPTNLKLGLRNNIDLQLVFDDYLTVRIEDRRAHQSTRTSGFGDLTTRLKINLWGNDGGRTAFALLPFVKFPTNTHDLGNSAIEGGVILPLAVRLPAGWDMGLEAAGSCRRNDNGQGRHAEFVHSITLGHAIMGRFAGYGEFFSSLNTEAGRGWVATADFGLTYDLTENVQLDAGANLGLTHAAAAVNLFAGVTARF